MEIEPHIALTFSCFTIVLFIVHASLLGLQVCTQQFHTFYCTCLTFPGTALTTVNTDIMTPDQFVTLQPCPHFQLQWAKIHQRNLGTYVPW